MKTMKIPLWKRLGFPTPIRVMGETPCAESAEVERQNSALWRSPFFQWPPLEEPCFSLTAALHARTRSDLERSVSW